MPDRLAIEDSRFVGVGIDGSHTVASGFTSVIVRAITAPRVSAAG